MKIKPMYMKNTTQKELTVVLLNPMLLVLGNEGVLENMFPTNGFD